MFLRVLLALSFFLTLIHASELKHGAKYYVVEGDVEAKYNELLEKTLRGKGFALADPHKRINDAYKKKYGSTELDLISFFTIVKESKIKPLFNIDPRIAGFNPFNLLAFKRKDSKYTKIGHLTPETIVAITGVTDKRVIDTLNETMKELDATVEAAFPKAKVEYIDYKALPDDKVMNFEYTFDKDTELEDFIDEFQEGFEEAFEDKEYIIAGFYNFKESLDGTDSIENFDAFWTYSLCHFKYSYTVFDGKDGVPQAGVFAPCTMYMYIKKGTNKLVIGMPKLQNWANVIDISDKKRLDFIHKLDTEIPAIMKELGAVEIDENTPKARTDIPVARTLTKPESKKEEASSASTPVSTTVTASNASGVVNNRASAYLQGTLMSAEDATKSLQANGFEVLSEVSVDKKGNLKTILFTDSELKMLANKSKRGFMGVLRLLIDKKNNQVSVTNPLYFERAFLQQDYNDMIAKKHLAKINKSFSNLKNSRDALNIDDLEDYHFMVGMPYYKDMEVIATGSMEELLAKARKSGKVNFELKLSNNKTLIGVKLGKRTEKFAKKIGSQNSILLPYTILIESGEAKVLAPKYYIALNYPLLAMSEFMTIATVPGAIIKDCEKIFN